MFPITELSVKRIGDIPAGNLILFWILDRYVPAIRVQSVDLNVPAALILVQLENGPRGPVCLNSNDYSVDLGKKPLLLWDWSQNAISNNDSRIPSSGHIAVMGEERLISGAATTNGGGVTSWFYWSLNTGLPHSDPRSAGAAQNAAIYISCWSLGVTDVSGEFQSLATFPFPAAAASGS